MKKTVVIVIIMGVLGGMICGIYQLIQSFREDQKEAEKNRVSINENYEKFNEDIELFNNKSELLRQEMEEELYYTTLKNKNANIVKILGELDDVVTNIRDIDSILNDKCKIYYKDVEVNQKCQTYNVSTESVITVFEEAVENYNKVIADYNAWVEKEGNSSYSKIVLYQSENVNS